MEKYRKLTGEEIKEYRNKYIVLPPQPTNILRICQALKAGIPVEYFVDQGIVDLGLLKELPIEKELRDRFIGCFRFYGKLPEGYDVDNYLKEVEKTREEKNKKNLEKKIDKKVTSREVKQLENIIEDLREEIGEVRESSVNKQAEIDKLKGDLSVRDEKIRMLQNRVDSLMEEMADDYTKRRSAIAQYKEMEANIGAYEDIIKEKSTQLEMKDIEIENMRKRVESVDEVILNKEKAIKEECEIKINEYKKLMDEYERIYTGSSVSKEDPEININVDLNLKKAKIDGKKIIGIYGDTKSYIKDGVIEGDNVYVALEPEDADIKIVVATPDKSSVQRLKDFIKESPDCIKIMNMWDSKAPYTAQNMAGVYFDLVIDYDSKSYIKSWVEGFEEKKDWVERLNEVIRVKM